MRLPRLFKRQASSTSYTQATTASLISQAAGRDSLAKNTAVVEIAAGLYQRGMSAGRVSGPANIVSAITPRIMGIIGRELILYGNSILAIEVGENGVILRHPEQWSLLRNDVEAYSYQLTMHTNKSVQMSEASVIHFKYGISTYDDRIGLSPLASANNTARMISAIEQKLADEASNCPVGYILPLPRVEKGTIADIKASLRGLKGKLLAVETTSGGWGEGRIASPSKDWEAKRLGMNPPQQLLEMRKQVERSILEACGVPMAIVSDEGVGQRSAYSRFIHTSLEPVAREVAHEFSTKLNADIKIDFANLVTHTDLSTKAKSFKSLVNGGMAPKDAALLAELERDETK